MSESVDKEVVRSRQLAYVQWIINWSWALVAR